MNDFEQFSLLFSQCEKKLQQLKNHAFDTLNIKPSTITCIILLKNNHQGLTAKQLCMYSSYDKSLISRIINELSEKEYICRHPDDKHKQRNYRLILTPSGWAFSKEVDQIMGQLQIAFEKDIPKDELQQFYQTIQKLAKNINAYEIEKEG